MIQPVDTQDPMTLKDYASNAQLSAAVQELRDEAFTLIPRLKGRKLWMVSSTARGGGVAEMLPKLVSLLRELGLPTEWVVIQSDRPGFFVLTKRIHNLIHGEGEPTLTAADGALYEAVSRENARLLEPLVGPDDLLVVHDPQPLGAGAILKRKLGIPAIWRCHIGLDEQLPATRAAWDFLRPFAEPYDYAVFSAPEYIPDFLAGRSGVIHPALNPLSHKNRELSTHKLMGVLCNARLALPHQPVLTPPFRETAMRLQYDGSFAPASVPEELGLLYRPIVTQISRWDRLKGFRPLLEGFVRLKGLASRTDGLPPRHRRRLEIVRLVLAGPDPAFIQDDPEGKEVLEELKAAYLVLPPELMKDVALLSLPMTSRKENALMVNALQRCSSVVVQNSLREGFGLTIAEAMWKRVAVVGTRACGIRQQVREGIDGRLVDDARDPDHIAAVLDALLASPKDRDVFGRNGQRRVSEEFLIFTQARHWLRCLSAVAGYRNRSRGRAAGR